MLTREEEIALLAAQQDADDTPFQRPQEFGGDHGRPTWSLDERRAVAGDALDPAAADTVESVVFHEEPDDSLADAVLAALTDPERRLYEMLFDEGLSVRQIAARIEASKSSVHRAKGALRDRLAEEYLKATGGDNGQV